MTKRSSQVIPAVVPVAQTAAAANAAAAVAAAAVAAAAAEVAAAEVAAAEGEEELVDATPADAPVAAPLAMVDAPAAVVQDVPMQQGGSPASAATTAGDTGEGARDVTPFIVGGALLAGGILAVALSGDNDRNTPAPTPTPTPPPTPTQTVAISSPATATIAENTPAGPTGNVVIDVNATPTTTGGATAGAVTFTLGGADAAFFTINPGTGEVRFVNSPNFEAARGPTFNITVTATAAASGGAPAATATQAIVVTVTNVNEAPSFASATATATVVENTPVATPVFTAVATDPDAGDVLAYSLGGRDAALFTINAQTGQVFLRNPADFEANRQFVITVTATDRAGLASAPQTVTINVTDVNEAPTVAVPTAAVAFAENQPTATPVFTATARDPEGQPITFSLTGPDAALFAISPTGVVTFRASPDFEGGRTTFNVSVVASDGVNSVTSTPVTVNVTNVNEAPIVTVPTTAIAFAENQATATPVFTATARDPEGTAVTFGLTGPDAALFAISPTGVVTFRASPDFEGGRTTFNVSVTASDGVNTTTSAPVTINVTDVNEPPVVTVPTTAIAFAENQPTTTPVFTATARDPEGQPITFSLTGPDAALFAISPTGVVTFRASPDFESGRTTFNVSVIASDGVNSVTSTAVTVNVTDVNEGVRIDGPGIPATTQTPFDAAGGNITFLESAAAGNLTTINNFGVGDIIQTDVATGRYSFTSNGTTLIISLNNNGVITRIEAPNAVSSNAFIFDEASAEAAVGFDFFRTSATTTPTPPPTPTPSTTTALDGAGAPTTFNAANAAVTFTDSATAPNNSVINNFGADDRVVVTGVPAGARYSFTSQDNDLIISFNNGGVVSRITINDVVSPNAFIFDEASAEAAVGFDFFRYG